MQNALERRKLVRKSSDSAVSLTWRDEAGDLLTEENTVVDISVGGMAFLCAQPVSVGSCLILRCARAGLVALAQVRHCSWHRASYRAGVRYLLKAPLEAGGEPADFHDFLRLAFSNEARGDDRTEQLFRRLSFRYHPDNRETGDAEIFLAIREVHRIAFSARSMPESRIAEVGSPARDFQSVRSESRREAERRIRVLSLLYQLRMTDCQDAGLPVSEIASITGAAVKELAFSLWYLREKGLVTASDSAVYAISVSGVDTFETLSCEHGRMTIDAASARRASS